MNIELTAEELQLMKAAVFHYIIDVNHPKEKELKLHNLCDKLKKL